MHEGSLSIRKIGWHLESFPEIHCYIKLLWDPQIFCIFDFEPLWLFDFVLDQFFFSWTCLLEVTC